ncbi:MAG TPA: DUF397 domain-containing protein [Streptomyces sp.]|nr:DUF397 domain-containing protein [Streptomyces sp.]
MNTTDLAWFKSSYSSGGDGDCVEVALARHKSTYSSSGSGDCVEVASCPDTVHVRDSKDKEGPQLTIAPDAWTHFLSHTSRA